MSNSVIVCRLLVERGAGEAAAEWLGGLVGSAVPAVRAETALLLSYCSTAPLQALLSLAGDPEPAVVQAALPGLADLLLHHASLPWDQLAQVHRISPVLSCCTLITAGC